MKLKLLFLFIGFTFVVSAQPSFNPRGGTVNVNGVSSDSLKALANGDSWTILATYAFADTATISIDGDSIRVSLPASLIGTPTNDYVVIVTLLDTPSPAGKVTYVNKYTDAICIKSEGNLSADLPVNYVIFKSKR